MARSQATALATGHDVDARKMRHLEIGQRLDAANAAVLAALGDGDCREHAICLIERAWVEMLMRDLHGGTTVLGRSWEQHMLRDVELAVLVSSHLRRTRRLDAPT